MQTLQIPRPKKILGVSTQLLYTSPQFGLKIKRSDECLILDLQGFSEDEHVLGYGLGFHCAMTAHMLKQMSREEHSIIGSGFAGLIAAIQLHKMGKPVTVYDQSFPTHGDYSYQLQEPSKVRASMGVCLPFYSTKVSNIFAIILKSSSLTFLEHVIDSKSYRGLKWQKAFIEGTLPPGEHPALRKIKAESVKVQGRVAKGTSFEYIQMNADVFLYELYSQAVFRGVKFVKRTFNSREQIQKLSKVVINTDPQISYKFLGLTQVRVLRKSHLCYEAHSPSSFFLKAEVGGRSVSCMSDGERVLLGEVVQVGEQGKEKEQLEKELLGLLERKASL